MAIQNSVGGSVYCVDSHIDPADITPCVRRADAKDVEDIALIALGHEGENWYWTPERVADGLNYFFVEGDDEVHGFVRAEPTGDDYVLLTQIAVKPQYRRTGVATRLLRAMEDIAIEAGLKGVINVGPKTPEIFKVYEKLGYKDVGESPYGRILVKEVNNG